MRNAPGFLLLLLLMTHLAAPAFAWSHKEHIMLTRLAALRLQQRDDVPADLKAWLAKHSPEAESLEAVRQFWLEAEVGAEPTRDAVPGALAWWAIRPDLAKGEPNGRDPLPLFGVREAKLHFIDLELLLPDDEPRQYRHDLSAKPAVDAVPNDAADARYLQAGKLPFAVALYARRLAELFPADHALPAAGYLAHYVQDNTQPHHATIDFRSRTYFGKAGRAPDVHAQMEWVHAESPEMRDSRARTWDAMLTALAEPPQKMADDAFVATVEIASKSYDHLPLIGLAAMHAADQAGTPEAPEGPPGTFDTAAFYAFEQDGLSVELMKARQLARAVQRTEQVWLDAWRVHQAE
ncbi:MAG: hypothetical protein ACFCVE_07525 [Phycisphaerae bacterium]